MALEPAVRRLNVQLPADVTIQERDLCDLEMLLMGAFAPLAGYLNMDDFCSVTLKARLSDGALWPIPIVLPVAKSLVSKSENPEAARGHWMNIRDVVGTVLARIKVEDCYEPNINAVGHHVLGTTDTNHPYMHYLTTAHQDVLYVGGQVQQCHQIFHFDFRELRRTPKETREWLAKQNAAAVVGFQTRNPMHRSHFELTRQAVAEVAKSLEQSGETAKKPHLLLSPACGPTQPGDIKSTIRIRCYQKLLPYYQRLCNIDVTLVLLPLAMRMAGPREALWHALIRRNYGCTHFIVGRDHAGPSTRKADGSPFYDPYAAHKFLESVRDEIGVTPVFGKNMVYISPANDPEEEGTYVQEDRAPKDAVLHQISGTAFRRMLQERLPVPSWFSFPPVIEELQSFYRQRIEQGFCVYFTGLPCSGKSTLATAIEARLQERGSEKRQVTVFDADIIRLHLSKGLGFSREDRSINVRRIGYVASLVVQHGGICLVANIAPYEEDRLYNRQLVTSVGGGYIEVHVSTPLRVCEERDVKHLYKGARLGVIKQFTGVSDPYEVPTKAELTVDSSDDILGKVNQIMDYLKEHQWVV